MAPAPRVLLAGAVAGQANVVREDNLELITSLLSRIRVPPFRGPGFVATVVAAAYLFTRSLALSNSTRQTVLVFATAGLTSMPISAILLNLETPNDVPVFPDATSLIFAVAVSHAIETVRRLRDRNGPDAQSRIQPTTSPRAGDAPILTGLSFETWQPHSSWFLLETRALPHPAFQWFIAAHLASPSEDPSGGSATSVGLYRIETDTPAE